MSRDYVIMANELCPHCAMLQAVYAVVDNELVLKCPCGYYEVVYSERYQSPIIHTLPKNKTILPRRGTKLSRCLGAVASHHPNIVTTGFIATNLEIKNVDAANQLMVLQHKGLVAKLEDCRGKVGGSTWQLTHRAIEHLNIRSR